jgi:hypothetical protein
LQRNGSDIKQDPRLSRKLTQIDYVTYCVTSFALPVLRYVGTRFQVDYQPYGSGIERQLGLRLINISLSPLSPPMPCDCDETEKLHAHVGTSTPPNARRTIQSLNTWDGSMTCQTNMKNRSNAFSTLLAR